MCELQVLQAVRLKGRIRPTELAATVGADPATVERLVESLTAAGYLVSGASVRLSPAGRARLGELLAQERAGADADAVRAAYDRFRAVNEELRALVSAWQLRPDAAADPDAANDEGRLLARLDGVHARVMPIVADVAAALPRLGGYATKLAAAHARIRGGDTSWLARPLVDSYHTVWFELHEELLGAAGLTREDESAG
ncbi:winged helix-turn-helix domain-containing protein [Mycobacterium sp. MYCO198283]|uniref:helix-turn-helix domain-containing protein n=1 Tax=Mycobacterium sp. MYCO198283 TaxID=2883505 RepID=UPI001E3D42D8|nr:helix-turn-helix domain-containing protein [Mycobacterium sp. MYCO198283]MCG5433963.1 winged helix-turn-helix domain-containing protein [Mycobacterium sp. MYCO198283]